MPICRIGIGVERQGFVIHLGIAHFVAQGILSFRVRFCSCRR
jgi:hypothetical protein